MAKSSTKPDPFVDCIVTLAEAFRAKVTATTVKAYKIGLEGIDIKDLERGVAKAIRTCKFMPSASELRELSGEMSLADRALMAFAATEKALGRFGVYKSLDFDDRAINATVRALGGLERICDVPANEWQFLRKRFLETYCAYVRSGVSTEAGLPCCGHFDRENTAKGYETSNLEHVKTGLPELRGITGPPQKILRIESGGPKPIGAV